MITENQITMAVESYRDAQTSGGEIGLWRPPLASADHAILRSAPAIRARARDLVRNNPYAKNAVRMNRDAVSGSGLKLALKIDWRALGLKNIEQADEWQDSVVRQWESFAEGYTYNADARRRRTFSQIFAVVDQADYVDGESIAVLELKRDHNAYETCINLIDCDRLSNPNNGPDGDYLRSGIEMDAFGEAVAYHIRAGHPADIATSMRSLTWSRVERVTPWGRPIVLHTFDDDRPEQSRGVSAFASAIVPMKMLAEYNDTELQTAIVQAAYAAVIKTELDWSQAMQVVGAQLKNNSTSTSNALLDVTKAYLSNAAGYHEKSDITWRGTKIPHLLPNETLEVIKSSHPNSNFADFEKAFLRQLAAGLGVEAHELSKNYADVNYSAARAALAAVWRTYRTRRNRLVAQFAMPFFSAWLEEAVAIGTVPLPPGVTDWLAARQYIVRGTFIAWGKPQIDPLKERQGQQLGQQLGAETLEEIVAEDGQSWRENLEQQAYEARYRRLLGLADPVNLLPAAAAVMPDATDTEG